MQGCDESGVGKFVSGRSTWSSNVIVASGDAAIAGATANTAAWRLHANSSKFDRNFYEPSPDSAMRFPPDLTFAQWQARGQDQQSVIGDAGFASPAASDYRLTADSAARRLGIQGPSYSEIGPRRTAALLRLRPPLDAFARYPFQSASQVDSHSWRRREDTACQGALPANHTPVPCLLVPTCESGTFAAAFDFGLVDGSGPAKQPTTVLVCHDPVGLSIVYSATDDNVESNFSSCQDHVWEADALEFMIYPGSMSADPGGNYSELDLSPHGALWAGRIHNPSGVDPLRNTTIPIPCNSSGIRWSAAIDKAGWGATLFVPWQLVSHPFSVQGEVAPGPPTRIWRANFARFDTPRGAPAHEQTAWSPTLSGSFHVPHRFGVLVLDQ